MKRLIIQNISGLSPNGELSPALVKELMQKPVFKKSKNITTLMPPTKNGELLVEILSTHEKIVSSSYYSNLTLGQQTNCGSAVLSFLKQNEGIDSIFFTIPDKFVELESTFTKVHEEVKKNWHPKKYLGGFQIKRFKNMLVFELETHPEQLN